MSAAASWDVASDRELLERCWLPVAFADVLDAPVAVTLLGRPLVVYADADGRAVVADDRCPHRGARLAMGTVVAGELQCPYHGWRFGRGGSCARVPSQPSNVPLPSRADLAALESATFGGIVWCRLDRGTPLTALPDWPEATDPAFRLVHPEAQCWQTSAGRQVENFLDVSHFSFVHAGTFGNPDDTLVGDLDVADTAGGLVQRFDYVAANPDVSPLGGMATVQRRMTYQVDLPYSSRLEIAYPDGRRDVVLLASAPISPEACTVFVTVARNYDHDRPAAELLAWDVAILEEDRPVVEAQVPPTLPLDLTAEVHVKSDRATVAYRRALRGLGFTNG